MHCLNFEDLLCFTAVGGEGKALMREERDQVQVDSIALKAGGHLVVGVEGSTGIQAHGVGHLGQVYVVAHSAIVAHMDHAVECLEHPTRVVPVEVHQPWHQSVRALIVDVIFDNHQIVAVSAVRPYGQHIAVVPVSVVYL